MAVESPKMADPSLLIPFKLKGTDERTHSLDDVRGENGTVLMFICNHCPYVRAVIDRLVEDCRVLQDSGIGCVAIMPNDTTAYPADSFENMQRFTAEHGFTFPYLIDDTQQVARAYGAVCTPDLFGFNKAGELQYRGRVDSAGAKPPSWARRAEKSGRQGRPAYALGFAGRRTDGNHKAMLPTRFAVKTNRVHPGHTRRSCPTGIVGTLMDATLLDWQLGSASQA